MALRIKKGGRFKGKCHNCGRVGHKLAECFQKKKEAYKEKEQNVSLSSVSGKIAEDSWILDSGASHHMTGDESLMMELRDGPRTQFQVANGEMVESTKIGAAMVIANGKPIKVEDIYLVPGLKANLLSVPAITKKGFTVVFKENQVTVSKGQVHLSFKKINGIFIGKVQKVLDKELQEHRQLGHVSIPKLRELKEKGLLDTLPEVHCEACAKGKFKRGRIPKESDRKATVVGERIHSDVCGPFQEKSLQGNSYYVSFTDEYSRYSYVQFMRNKDEVTKHFKQYVVAMKTQLDATVK